VDCILFSRTARTGAHSIAAKEKVEVLFSNSSLKTKKESLYFQNWTGETN